MPTPRTSIARYRPRPKPCAIPRGERLTQTDRGRLIRRLADLIAGSEAALAEIETRDNGKLMREMRAQVRRPARHL